MDIIKVLCMVGVLLKVHESWTAVKKFKEQIGHNRDEILEKDAKYILEGRKTKGSSQRSLRTMKPQGKHRLH